MSIPLEGRLDWRRSAPFHVQLELDSAPSARARSGKISGRVVRIFRSDGRVALADHVTFELWVCQRDEIPTGPAFIFEDVLEKTSHMEAYLTGNPPKLEVAAYEFCSIDGPTEAAVLSPEQLEDLLAQLPTLSDPAPARDVSLWARLKSAYRDAVGRRSSLR
jgi:hypothetical protein